MDNMFKDYISNLGAASFKSIPKKEGDYYDEETGLLMCGQCNTPKETIINTFEQQMKVRCMCQCMASEYHRKEEEAIRKQRYVRMMERRSEAFPTESLAECTFKADRFPDSDLSRVSRNYVKHFREFAEKGRGLCFFGKPGTGKTFYACCIANALLDNNYSVMVTSFSRIANSIQGMKGNTQDYIDHLNEYDLLVIDDYSVERNTEYMVETVFNVVDSRIKSGRPMIVTTNLAREQMKTQAQTNVERTRILSRLFETCTFFEAKGEDIRMKMMKEEDQKYRSLLLKED